MIFNSKQWLVVGIIGVIAVLALYFSLASQQFTGSGPGGVLTPNTSSMPGGTTTGPATTTPLPPPPPPQVMPPPTNLPGQPSGAQ